MAKTLHTDKSLNTEKKLYSIFLWSLIWPRSSQDISQTCHVRYHSIDMFLQQRLIKRSLVKNQELLLMYLCNKSINTTRMKYRVIHKGWDCKDDLKLFKSKIINHKYKETDMCKSPTVVSEVSSFVGNPVYYRGQQIN